MVGQWLCGALFGCLHVLCPMRLPASRPAPLFAFLWQPSSYADEQHGVAGAGATWGVGWWLLRSAGW
jgi:hypothetical protein